MLYQAWTKRMRGEKKATLLLSWSMNVFSGATELNHWCDSFIVVGFISSLSTVCCAVLFCYSESWADCVLLKMPKTFHRGERFLPCCSLGLCKAPWVSFPLRLCPVLCLWPVLCTVVLPSYHKVPLIPLKSQEALTWGITNNAVFSLFFKLWCFSEGQAKQIHYPLCYFKCYDTYRQTENNYQLLS